jgi:nickel-dependent lactate racemase
MRIRLDYGRDGLDVEVPDASVAAVLNLSPRPAHADPSAAVRRALATPHGSPPLRQLAAGRASACVVISDITRPVPNRLLLPPILADLEAAGIPRAAITILIATGTHRASTPAERIEMVGEELAARYRLEDHDARDLPGHAYLGDSPRGVPAWVDRRFLEAELRLSCALIEPHFMAGFSGGRKNICPGVCAMETVRVWHGPRFIGHARAEAGSVDGNPVHEDALWVARRAGLHFICDVTLDEERRITGVFAGEPDAAWRAGVEFARGVCEAPLEAPVDVVLTTCAGYPLDLTFYQAVKGMVGALPALKEGGDIVLAAQCAEGLGGTEFAETLLATADLEEFVARTCEPGFFIPDQWELHELLKAVRRARVLVFCEGIPAETLRRCFVEPVPSVEDGVARALKRHGPGARMAVIPRGPYVIPVVRAGQAAGGREEQEER